jgi:starch synthase
MPKRMYVLFYYLSNTAARCALLSCDQWGTVSTSYRDDLIRTSPLGPLLGRFPQPFGKQNGIRLEERLALLKGLAKDHDEAKAILQKKYFGESDPSIPIFAFIGRIVLQKGVHLILNAVRELVEYTKGRIQILVQLLIFPF